MISSRSPLLSRAAIFGSLLLLSFGCEQGSKVRSTVPADGEVDVDPRTSVRVTFSSTFNSTSDTTEHLTDTQNFRVTGESGQVYKGSIAVKTAAQAALEATAQALGSSSTSAAAAAAATTAAAASTTGSTSQTASSSTTSNSNSSKSSTTNSSSSTTKKKTTANTGITDNDTLVFTLDPSQSFQTGELITVQVGGTITVHGTPINEIRFSFRVRGETALQLLGDLRVRSTSPLTEALGAAQRPRISARFTQSVKPDAIAAAMVLRGMHSGVHAAGETVFPTKESDTKVLEVAQRLSATDSFLPGEWVEVNLSDAIQGAAASTGTSTTPSTTAATLPPYGFRFQVVGGKLSGPWFSPFHAVAGDHALGVVAGNLRQVIQGTEFVALSPDRVDLFFFQKDAGDWGSAKLEGLSAKGVSLADGAIADLDGDGVPELVLLTSIESGSDSTHPSGDGSWLRTFLVGAAGGLVEKDTALPLPARQARKMLVTDIDGNGHSDILVLHPDRQFSSTTATGTTVGRTGNLTILEKSQGVVDPTKINLNDLNSIGLAFHRIDNPIPDLPPAARMEAHDLDGDGKKDLVVETTAEGGQAARLLLVQNRGTRTDRFHFRIARALLGRGGQGFLAPSAWVVADLDGDGDLDILAWDDAGALLYKNRLDPRTQDPARPELRGLVFEDVVPVPVPSLPRLPQGALPPLATDLDGDRSLDLVLAEPSGKVTLLLSAPPAADTLVRPLVFYPTEFSAGVGGRVTGLTVGDVDGDSGLDLVLVGDGTTSGPTLGIFRATTVTSPGEATSSFYINTALSAATSSDILVVVSGDTKEPFTGYTLALDYDEDKLSFLRFEEPAEFSGIATFTPCPDAKGAGCPGFASVKMAYSRSTTAKPRDRVLGTFRFQPKITPAIPVRTTIALAGGLPGANGATINNTLVIVDGQSQTEEQVQLAGDPYVVSLEPPALPLLVITACQVLDPVDGVFPARVAWTTRGDALFSGFEVWLDGALLEALDSLARETQPFHLNTGGTHTVELKGLALDGSVLADLTCSLSTIFRPEVKCSQILSGKKVHNVLSWSIAGDTPVDNFQIQKNGAFYKTVSGSVFSEEDSNASETGADLYEVSGVINLPSGKVVGPPGRCVVNDPTPDQTLPPQNLRLTAGPRPMPGDPISLKMTWTNGEAYDKIRLRILTDAGTEVWHDELAGTRTDYTYPGDLSHGGVLPQIYRFSLVGVSNNEGVDVLSAEGDATSFALPVVVPTLGSVFTCEAPLGNEVLLKWDPVWGGYTSFTLTVVGPDGPRTIAIPVTDLEHRDTVLPSGTYQYTLKAAYEAGLPASLVPNASSLERHCAITFRPTLRLGQVESGVGLKNVLIPIRADLFAPVSGVHFAVLLPSQLQVDLSDPHHPETAVRLLGAHDGATLTATLGAASADPQSRPRQRLEVDVSGAQFTAGRDQVLLWVVGRIDADFKLAGIYPLNVDGQVTIVPQGTTDPLPIASEDLGAQLNIRKRFLVVDREPARAGDTQPTLIRVLGTFDGYEVVAYVIHLKFDPDLLELLPISRPDQLETAVSDTGLFTFAPSTGGEVLVIWLLTSDQTLKAGINQPLLFLKFRTKVPKSPAGSFAAIQIVKDSTAVNPSALFPASQDGAPLDAWFDGGIDISMDDIPTLLSITPLTGSLAGGGEAMVNGFGFLAGVTKPEEQVKLKLISRPAGGLALERPVEWIAGREFKANLLEFLVPNAGITSPSLLATKFDVDLTTPNGHSVLPDAFQYEYLRLTAADRLSGSAAGGDLVTLTGFGMGPRAEVRFKVAGSSAGDPGFKVDEIVQADADGRRLVLKTPAMPGSEGKKAAIVVSLPTVLKENNTPVTDTLAQPFSIGSGPAAPQIVSLQPVEGPVGGGSQVQITFSGFDGTQPLQVFFGDQAAAAVSVAGQVATAATPAHAAGAVPVKLVRGALLAVQENGFLYRDPRVLSATPSSGPLAGGTPVTLALQDFGAMAGAPQVRFGSAAATVTSSSASAVQVLSPPGAGAGAVDVSVTSGALANVLKGGFTYEAAPVLSITGVSPSSGVICGGETVTVAGTGFAAGLKVRFGTQLASSVRVLSATSAEAVTPLVAENITAVAVGVSSDGTNFTDKPAAFTFRDDRPLFIRGDVDGDGKVKITDSIALSDYLSGVRTSLPNADAADVNDDGVINITDLGALNGFLFQGTGAPPAPYPNPGRDPTPDLLRGCGQ